MRRDAIALPTRDRWLVSESHPDDGADAATRARWRRFDERLELLALRPRLAHDVRLRTIGDDVELVQTSTRRVVPLEPEHVPLVRRLDGAHSMAELLLAGSNDRHFSSQRLLSLVDRLVRAELLADDVPASHYRNLVDLVARLAIGVETAPPESAEDASRPAQEHVPWRPLTGAIEERARFLRRVRLLEPLDDEAIGRLAELAHEETWPAASDIVSEGGRSDRFFVVRSGEVNVARRDDAGERHRLGTLGAGDWFGEAGLRDGAPRNATVRASLSKPVQLYSFDAGIFEQFIEPHLAPQPERELVVRRRAQLGRVPLFRALAPDDLDRLAAALTEVAAPRGTVLFRQGEPADRFYVIVDGAVGVVRDGRPIARLIAGEFFGETALLFTEERTATIAATEDTVLWALDRSAFTALVRDALLHRHDMMPTVLGRIASTDPM